MPAQHLHLLGLSTIWCFPWQENIHSLLSCDPHQVKKEAESFLRSMAKELAQTPEIRTLADDIITSILDPRKTNGTERCRKVVMKMVADDVG